jgi:hypothetical protein
MALGQKTGGRAKGTPNRVTREIKDVLRDLAGKYDTHARRLHTLTQSGDEQVAVKALAIVFAYRFGKPKESVELHVPELVKVRFVDA